MKKFIGLVGIILVFGISTFLIVKIPKPARSGKVDQVIARTEGNSEEWLGIFLQGQRIGYSFTNVAKTTTGLKIENRSQMTLMMMNAKRTVVTHLYCITDCEYTLQEFALSIETAGHTSRVEGKVIGKNLELTAFSQGIRHEQTITLQDKPYLPTALDEVIKKKNMKPGDEIIIPYFDPTTQSQAQARIKMLDKETVHVLGEEKIGTRVEMSVLGLNEIIWFDDDFNVLKRETPAMGMEMIPLTRNQALAEIEQTSAFDLLSFFSVKPDRPLANTADLIYLKLELSNIEPTDLRLDNDYQRLISHDPVIVEFHRPELDTLPDLILPIKEHKDFLEPSVYIQCTNPEIISQARQFVGKEKNARFAVGKLVTGVYRLLDKNPTASLPSAIDVLKTKEGDCNEHSILFAALARAIGIPTKIYVGLVSLQGSAYFYHAWCAVWLNKWVPVDPTFNQYPADLGHLKLQEGEVSEWAKVLQVVGKLQIKVIDAQYE